MDEPTSSELKCFIYNGKIMAAGAPKELIEKEQVGNLEDVFIRYVERSTNQKIEASFEELKGIVGG